MAKSPKRKSLKRRHRRAPLLVAIVGGSGSGKTWLADKLQAALGRKAGRLSLDDFYLDRSSLPLAQRAKINFDHPRAIDWAGVERVLRDCRAGKPSQVPCYDFKTHARLRSTTLLRPTQVILVDGLWLLRSPSLRRRFGLRVFLECPASLRLRRRLARDVAARGRSRASVTSQFWKTVQPMHRKHVAPQACWANVILQQDFGRREIERLELKIRQITGGESD
jgi:uridine kinase